MYKTEKFFTPAEIAAKAKRTGATPFMVSNVPFSHQLALASRSKVLNGAKAPKGIDQQIYDAVYSLKRIPKKHRVKTC